MAHDADKAGRARRRIRVWHGLLVLVVVLVATVLVLRWHWKRELRQRIAALVAAGYPVTPAELDASYAWPESGENGADLVIGASSFFVDLPQEDARELLEIIGWSNRRGVRAIHPDTRELLLQHVQANAKARERLYRCATVEQSRYPIDLSQGMTTLVPWVSDARKCGLLLCYEAITHAEREDSEGAICAIEAAFDVTRTLRNEPVCISQMVYLSMARYCAMTIERVACRCHLSAEQLNRLDRCVSRIDVSAAVRSGMVSDQCLNLELFVSPGTIDAASFNEFPTEAVVDLYAALGLAAREGVVYLDLMAQCLAAAQQPTSERCQAAAAIKRRYSELAKSHLLLRNAAIPWYLLKAEVRSLACVRCAKAALAVERYRLGRGRLPETLGELAPEYLDRVPEDPYDGESLRYTKLERGFVVYSVGEDGVDEGGKEKPPRGDGEPGETYDITFVVAR